MLPPPAAQMGLQSGPWSKCGDLCRISSSQLDVTDLIGEPQRHRIAFTRGYRLYAMAVIEARTEGNELACGWLHLDVEVGKVGCAALIVVIEVQDRRIGPPGEQIGAAVCKHIICVHLHAFTGRPEHEVGIVRVDAPGVISLPNDVCDFPAALIDQILDWRIVRDATVVDLSV